MLHAMWLPEITIRQGHPAPDISVVSLAHALMLFLPNSMAY